MVAVTVSRGREMDMISDAVDEVNVLKDKLRREREEATAAAEYAAASKFDEEKDKEAFRNYEDAKEHVKVRSLSPSSPHAVQFLIHPPTHATPQRFYAEQHAKQTLSFNLAAREEFHKTTRARMTIWEAIEKLDTLVDESDPDTDVGQIQHLLQVSSRTSQP